MAELAVAIMSHWRQCIIWATVVKMGENVEKDSKRKKNWKLKAFPDIPYGMVFGISKPNKLSRVTGQDGVVRKPT